MVSLLIWYCHIPHYFCFSTISFPSLIHHHAPCQHDLPHDTCEPLQLLMHGTCLHWTLYHLHYWTSFVYQMDRWPMDLAVTFPFLGTSCTISFILIPFPPYHFHTVLCNSSWQSPNVPCHGLTSHEPLCHVVRDLLLVHLRWALCSISWLSFIFKLPVFTVQQERYFPTEFRLSKYVQPDQFTAPHLASYPHCALYPHIASYLCVTPYLIPPCTFTSLCLVSFPHIGSPPVLPLLLDTDSPLPHQETITYPQIAPSEPHWAYATTEPYCSLLLI